MPIDPSQELTDLEQKLHDAVARFDRTPGAMWLATTAIIESATRLGVLSSELEARREDLLVRARRARDDAGPRSSENDVSAITAWVELAEKRAVLERAVKAALADLATHRTMHAWLTPTPSSRKTTERGLGDREQDVVEREARLALPIDPSETDALALLADKGITPAPDTDESDEKLLTRARAARARVHSPSGRWKTPAIVVTAIAALCSLYVVPEEHAQLVLGVVILALAALIAARTLAASTSRYCIDLLESHAMHRRDVARRDAAKENHALLIRTARAVGALDAFGATDDGRTLEERESKLVALAPWIRELVDGFTAEEASRLL